MAEANKFVNGGEGILLRAGDCTVTILPNLGGKIASILVSGHELLQAPLAAYAPRTKTMTFDAGDASGWDECLLAVRWRPPMARSLFPTMATCGEWRGQKREVATRSMEQGLRGEGRSSFAGSVSPCR